MIETPNLDRLAAEGVRLESYYVQAICTPVQEPVSLGKISGDSFLRVLMHPFPIFFFFFLGGGGGVGVGGGSIRVRDQFR